MVIINKTKYLLPFFSMFAALIISSNLSVCAIPQPLSQQNSSQVLLDQQSKQSLSKEIGYVKVAGVMAMAAITGYYIGNAVMSIPSAASNTANMYRDFKDFSLSPSLGAIYFAYKPIIHALGTVYFAYRTIPLACRDTEKHFQHSSKKLSTNQGAAPLQATSQLTESQETLSKTDSVSRVFEARTSPSSAPSKKISYRKAFDIALLAGGALFHAPKYYYDNPDNYSWATASALATLAAGYWITPLVYHQ